MPSREAPANDSGRLAATRVTSIEVRFEPSQRTVRVAPGTSLLDATRRAELPIAAACGADGVCARCGLEVLDCGTDLPRESERERHLKANNRIDPKLRLACRVKVTSPITVTAPYW
jgi:ferredoxin